jgi:hypothetical protein
MFPAQRSHSSVATAIQVPASRHTPDAEPRVHRLGPVCYYARPGCKRCIAVAPAPQARSGLSEAVRRRNDHGSRYCGQLVAAAVCGPVTSSASSGTSPVVAHVPLHLSHLRILHLLSEAAAPPSEVPHHIPWVVAHVPLHLSHLRILHLLSEAAAPPSEVPHHIPWVVAVPALVASQLWPSWDPSRLSSSSDPSRPSSFLDPRASAAHRPASFQAQAALSVPVPSAYSSFPLQRRTSHSTVEEAVYYLYRKLHQQPSTTKESVGALLCDRCAPSIPLGAAPLYCPAPKFIWLSERCGGGGRP